VEGDGGPKAAGGEVRIVRPWNPDDAVLTPLGFSCALPKG
jgi:hypothetical protein